jgi:hypothetical protein
VGARLWERKLKRMVRRITLCTPIANVYLLGSIPFLPRRYARVKSLSS